MILSEQKPIEEIISLFEKDYKNVLLIGCSECATLAGVGGEKELNELEKEYESKGYKVIGKLVFGPVCHILKTKQELRKNKEVLEKADVIVGYNCGAGVRSIAENTDIPVISGTNTLYLANIKRFGVFENNCKMCGDCTVGYTGGICAYASCPKGSINGPCGGMYNGKCEVYPERECIWIKIYEKLKKTNRLSQINKIFSPKPYRKPIVHL